MSTPAEAAGPVGAFAEPDRPVGSGYVASVSLANLAVWLAFFTPIQNLLPRLADRVTDGDGKEAALAVVAGVGAFVAIVANPLAGALSDRTRSRFGRRRPWVLGGALVGALAMLGLVPATSVLGLALVWAIAQGGLNAAYAGVTATIPDQVPVRQRGLVSGWVGLSQTVGIVLGVALVSFIVVDLDAGIVLTSVLAVALVLPFVLTLSDPVLERRERTTLREFLVRFWIDPRANPDFAWAWITRFLVSLGNAMATLYLLFFLQDRVGHPEPEQAQTIMVGIYALGTIATAVIGGRLSDRSGRRKIFVIVSTTVMAVAALILALVPTFPATLLAAAILGLGYGVYLAVDQALITQVLPAAADRARDLGVINIANSSPQVLAPVIAAPLVIGAGGYTTLYLLTAGITLLGAVLIRNIRSVP